MADKTVIKFKFVKPGGFSLSGYGNFWPELKMVLATDKNSENPPPKNFGNVWINGYDYDQIYSVTLPTEEPRELPPHINRNKDETVRTAYHIKQAEVAAKQHDDNNVHRDELAYLVSVGMIEIVSDSFMDKHHDDSDPALDAAIDAAKAEYHASNVQAAVTSTAIKEGVVRAPDPVAVKQAEALIDKPAGPRRGRPATSKE